MKRVLAIFLALALCLSWLPTTAFAAADSGTCGDDLAWELTDDGTLIISGTGPMTDFDSQDNKAPWNSYSSDITSVVVEEGMTRIGSYAFEACSDLTEIAIPTGVTSIGDGAFTACSSLESVTIPDSVTDIGGGAFIECSSLESVTIPAGVTTINMYTFTSCSSLTEITIPDSVTSIGFAALFECSSLESITIPEGVTSIAGHAFHSCVSLNSVEIPNQVASLGNFVFANCDSLTSITVPASVTSIGIGTFTGCDNLTEIWVSEDNQYYSSDESGVLFNEEKTALIQVPGGFPMEFVIPESVTNIGAYSLAFRDSMTGITIPAGVTSIELCAFYGCDNLESITIPAGVTSIGEHAFRDCISLTGITFTGNAPEFAEEVFYGITATVYYPSGDETWTSDVMLDYGGTITWKLYCVEHTWGEWVEDGNTSHRTCTVCGVTENIVSTGGGEVEIEIPGQPEGIAAVEVEYVEETSDERYILVEEAVSEEQEEEVLKVFDINLKDEEGTDVQPDGTVTVKLPLDSDESSDNTVYKVYRVNDDGTKTDMNAQQQGDCMVFETDHFSLYVIVKHTHTYTSDVTEPTCTGRGYTTHTCLACGDSYVDTYVAPAHKTQLQNNKAATCTEDGYTGDQVCTVCGETVEEGETIDAHGHDMADATCTEAEKCQREGCDHTEGTALGHQWDDGVVTTEPTEEAEGVKTYTCERCGDTKTESIPALEPTEPEEPTEPSVPSTPVKPVWESWLEKLFGDWWGDEEEKCDHEYTSVVTDPTCEEDGYTTHTCTKCGDTYKDSYTDALGHQYEDGVCTQCGEEEPVEPEKPNKPTWENIWDWISGLWK